MPGDAIEVHSWREPELSGEYQVDEAGIVILPLLGARDVTGIPLARLKRRTFEEYALQFQNQEVRVALLRRIRVLGWVQQPGLYHVDPTITIEDALALAGGPTLEGRTDQVRLFRAGKDYVVPLNGQETGPFHSGDQIFVPKRSWLSRHSGVLVGTIITSAAIIASAYIR
jgi:polysaccharide export outer membrane protein